jgi:DNA polymerase
VAPKILVCLGSPSAKAILGAQEGILRVRGRWTTYSFGLEQCDAIDAVAMLHPAYLLRQPAQKRLAWRDLIALRERLAEKSTTG